MKYTGNQLKGLLKLVIYACVEQYLMCDHTPYDILSHFYLADDLCSHPLKNHLFPSYFLALKNSQLPLLDL